MPMAKWTGPSREDMARGGLVGRDELLEKVGLSQGFEFFQGFGVVDGKLVDFGAAQAGHVGAAAKLLTQVVQEGADVSAFAAGEGEIRLGGAEVVDVELGDVDEAGFALHFLAFAGEFVEGLAVNLFGREHGRGLVLVAHEGIREFLEFFLGEVFRDGGFLGDLAFAVVGFGSLAEFHGSGVYLVQAHEELRDLGGLADQYDHQSGGDRIQCAGVADFLHPEDAAYAVDNVVGSNAGGFVNKQDAGGLVLGLLAHFWERGKFR